jgi:hypothetical protein
MNIYSPKSQKPDVFKKNTIKNQVTYSRKIATTGSVIEFELKEDKKPADTMKSGEKRRDPFTRLFDYLKDSFYERMKVFFDFEDKYKDKSKTFEFADD